MGGSSAVNEAIDDACDAIFEALDVKVNDEPNAQITKPQIGEDFHLIQACNFFLRFQIENHALLDQQIEPEIDGKLHGFVSERHGLLPFELQSSDMHLVAQGFFICSFDEPRP